MRINRQILIVLAVAAAVLGGIGLWTSMLKTEPKRPETVTATAPAPAPQTPAASPSPAAPGATATALAPRREGDDFVIGAENAPAVIIEYASLTCPHCARFHGEVLPRLKSEYIDRGLVRFIYRDFPLDGAALRAALIARCLPPERYFTFLDVLFRQQEQWASGRDVGAMVDRVKQLAGLAGLSRERAESCSTDQDAQTKVLNAAQTGEREYQIRSTPSLVINGKRHAGANSFEELEKSLQPLVKKP